jgi:hypothetical protein
MANEAVHELIEILKIIENQHEYSHIKQLIARLLPLFSTAYKSGKIIQGAGD